MEITTESLRNLNAWQHSGFTHPYTCGSGNRTDNRHLDGEGILVAIESGWICPFCDYSQDFRDWNFENNLRQRNPADSPIGRMRTQRNSSPDSGRRSMDGKDSD